MWVIMLVVLMKDGTVLKQQLEWVTLSSTKSICTVKRISINARHSFKNELKEVTNGEDYKDYTTKCVDLSE